MNNIAKGKAHIKDMLSTHGVNSNPLLLSIDDNDGEISYLFGADIDESHITSDIVKAIAATKFDTSNTVRFTEGKISRRGDITMFILYFEMTGEC